jgi:hypothetical protein
MGEMKEPNFFIVGAAKCGTTSLFNYMRQHPDLYFPLIKEPAHFVRDDSSYDRYADFDRYRSLFKKAGNAKAIGEASTGYLFYEKAAGLIHDKFPSAKIIIVLRNPVDMAFSYWRYNQAVGEESSAFEYVISDEGIKYRRSKEFKDKCSQWWGSYAYMDRGFYFEQVKRYFDVFGRDNVRVYIFERFIKDPKVVCSDIFEFLGIDSDFIPDYGKAHNEAGGIRSKLFKKMIYAKYPLLRAVLPTAIKVKIRAMLLFLNSVKEEKKEMPVSARQRLERFFSLDIKKLEGLLGEEIEEWRAK